MKNTNMNLLDKPTRIRHSNSPKTKKANSTVTGHDLSKLLSNRSFVNVILEDIDGEIEDEMLVKHTKKISQDLCALEPDLKDGFDEDRLGKLISKFIPK